MSNGVPRRVVVAYPRITGAAAWQQVLAVRRRYDPLATEMPAHLTLVFPFEDPLPDAALEAHVRSVVAGWRPLTITLAEITGHENPHLFLNVKRGNDELIDLHDRLYTGPLARHQLRWNTYVPHVTVGRLPTDQLSAALDATAGLTAAIPATVAVLTGYAIEPDDGRVVRFQVPLGSS
jgi:2'-5' RNA ligase